MSPISYTKASFFRSQTLDQFEMVAYLKASESVETMERVYFDANGEGLAVKDETQLKGARKVTQAVAVVPLTAGQWGFFACLAVPKEKIETEPTVFQHLKAIEAWAREANNQAKEAALKAPDESKPEGYLYWHPVKGWAGDRPHKTPRKAARYAFSEEMGRKRRYLWDDEFKGVKLVDYPKWLADKGWKLFPVALSIQICGEAVLPDLSGEDTESDE